MAHVYRRPASKAQVSMTAELRQQILAALQTQSQQAVARQFNVAQASVQRLAARARREAAQAIAELRP
jgi:transposase